MLQAFSGGISRCIVYAVVAGFYYSPIMIRESDNIGRAINLLVFLGIELQCS